LNVLNTIAKITSAHENDKLLHVIVMVSVKVQVRIGNKMLETMTASTITASTRRKNGTSIKRHVSSPKLNDIAVVFTNASHVLWITNPGFF
jgi:hypothetical protein